MNASALIGRSLPPVTVVVERGAVAAFARAVLDDSPVYRNADAAGEAGFPAIPVPPTFTFAAPLFAAFEELQPPCPDNAVELTELIAYLRAEGGLILHAEQEFTYHGQVYVGDVLRVVRAVDGVRVTTARDGRRMTFVRVRSDVHNQAGRLVVTEVMTLMHRA
ncbi:MaoC family dehydratase N-terminal domain-containing protein [Frankia sp. Mgl5]|uniref:FAS1-like dehydratase domain-containing protein n=1 Tax=Frankia sp. Mgl5 TaxID=2933793 RepID=UPI00200DBCA2|nr:MaoC family dehydratase N-terminal domain-containing protein [Frankia sp. Mgl5]MCK9926324.1 MaoC family dehydratase N-terminal domain-containing protein [Frankia sp. Mgl5]